MKDALTLNPMNQLPVNILPSTGDKLQSRVQAAQGADSDAKRNAELKKASQEFEAVFISYMLKVMRDTIEESGLLEGGFGKSIYTELFDQEVAMSFARRGTLGISNILYKSLSGGPNTPDAQNSDAVPEKGSEIGKVISTPAPSSKLDAPTSGQDEIPDFQLPVQAPMSSAFGIRRDPFSHQNRFHKGIDLAAPEGMTVVPALPGTVVSAGFEKGYGNTVLVRHEGGLETRYGHLGTINVRVGDSVSSQDVIGTIGSTGRSTGPHLHFEVIHEGRPVDPASTLNVNALASSRRLGVSKAGV